MVERLKATDAGRLRAEYNRLVNGLAQRGDLPGILDHALSFLILKCIFFQLYLI